MACIIPYNNKGLRWIYSEVLYCYFSLLTECFELIVMATVTMVAKYDISQLRSSMLGKCKVKGEPWNVITTEGDTGLLEPSGVSGDATC